MRKRFRITVLLLVMIAMIIAPFAGLQASPLSAEPAYGASAPKVVVLDPGHGGKEKGACYYGMEEKTLNLKIAKYCQAELNTYANVRVVMTRTTDKAVASGGVTPDLKARCRIAKNNKAAIFVCLHNNAYGAGESKKTNGARVYYQNNSFYKNVGEASHKLATMIVNRVAACGLANGGARTKYSPDKERRDPAGKKGDYYGVLFYNKQYKIPAVIVEHAFMSNKGDAAKLKKEAFLKSLGKADAAAIAEYLGLKKKPTAKKTATVRKGWYTAAGKKYYYNTSGKMLTGWQKISGKKYYFSKKDGHMLKGLHKIGKYYYGLSTSDGHMLKGLQTISGKKYYFSTSSGHMKTGWRKISGRKYYFSKKDGHMLTGWQKISGKKYYFSKKDGHMLTGKQKIDGKTYKFSSKGVLKK